MPKKLGPPPSQRGGGEPLDIQQLKKLKEAGGGLSILQSRRPISQMELDPIDVCI